MTEPQATTRPDDALEDRTVDDDTHDGIISIRCGHGANCSSIGSAVEMLFLSATVGAAILAAVAAALRPEDETAEPVAVANLAGTTTLKDSETPDK